MGLRIDRCACFEVPFRELRKVSRQRKCASVEQLKEHVAFGQQCGLCLPYVRRMLRTGETVFSEIIIEDDEPSSTKRNN